MWNVRKAMMKWLGNYILNLESVLVGKVSNPIAFFHVYSFFPLCGFMYLCVHSETRRVFLHLSPPYIRDRSLTKPEARFS